MSPLSTALLLFMTVLPANSLFFKSLDLFWIFESGQQRYVAGIFAWIDTCSNRHVIDDQHKAKGRRYLMPSNPSRVSPPSSAARSCCRLEIFCDVYSIAFSTFTRTLPLDMSKKNEYEILHVIWLHRIKTTRADTYTHTHTL